VEELKIRVNERRGERDSLRSDEKALELETAELRQRCESLANERSEMQRVIKEQEEERDRVAAEKERLKEDLKMERKVNKNLRAQSAVLDGNRQLLATAVEECAKVQAQSEEVRSTLLGKRALVSGLVGFRLLVNVIVILV
jgi:chromosome segregation ATPase